MDAGSWKSMKRLKKKKNHSEVITAQTLTPAVFKALLEISVVVAPEKETTAGKNGCAALWICSHEQ